jgi:hypothetical protein
MTLLLWRAFIHIRHAEFIHDHFLSPSFWCLDDETPSLAVQRYLAAADLPEEKEGLSMCFAEREIQLVRAHLLLQRVAQCVFGREEAVGRYQTRDALVWAEVVVMRNEMRQLLPRTPKILWFDPLPEFVPDRGPEALALSEGLGMVRA